MARKFFKTVIRVEVLSEDHSVEDYDLEAIAEAITIGDCSGDVTVVSADRLSARQCAKELQKQGSDPEFFGLDKNGRSARI